METMSTATGERALHVIALESDGVRIAVTADTRDIADRLPEVLPPEFVEVEADTVSESFGIVADLNGTYTYTRSDSPVSSDLDVEFALTLIQTQIRLYIGLNAPNRFFIHAGVVAVNGRAIVLPGRSFSGKTTLVAAFLRRGATYLSDEFAVFDQGGLVHPYLTKLSVRESEDVRRSVEATELGSSNGTEALPVAAIVLTSYQPGSEWRPTELSRGQAALGLLDNTVAAIERPDELLPLCRRITDGPLLLSSERGDTEPVVTDLLSRLA